jgi:hypothetical protein
MPSRIAILRRKVDLGEYELTAHAKDEMEQDGFTIQDVKSAIRSGRIITVRRDRFGRRVFGVVGTAEDARRLHVVSRLTEVEKRVRIITVFAQST